MNKRFFLIPAVFLLTILCFGQVADSSGLALLSYQTTNNDTLKLIPLVKTMNYNDSLIKGRLDAEKDHRSVVYFWYGVGAGALLPYLGIVISGLAADGSEPKIIPANVDESGYISGYHKKTKGYNRRAALIGSIMGTIATSVVINFAH